MRILRWLIAQVFGLLVTLGLAAGIAVGIQALLPLMTTEWIDDRWLKPLTLTTMVFSFLALTMLAVREYRRRRADKSG
jgi:cbb3-type cytochrome oxidase subunit 1